MGAGHTPHVTYAQQAGRVVVPDGCRVAVAVTVDFDAISLWDGTFGQRGPAYAARGEFGAEVAVPRLLGLFERVGVPTTWFVPGHTADTFPEPCQDVLAHGHEMAHHGYGHENPADADRAGERAVLERGLEALARLGVTPRGYRSPAWEVSEHTLDLLAELGFGWDSSLMANDVHPYRPRSWRAGARRPHGDRHVLAGPSRPSPAASVLEIPVSWFLDDFPTQEVTPGPPRTMVGTDHVERRWTDLLDFAATRVTGAVYTLTLHPQTVGRGHMLLMLERLLAHAVDVGGHFMTLSQVAAATVFDDGPDRPLP